MKETTSPRGLKPNNNYAKQVGEIEVFVKESKAYLKGKRTTKNLPYEAMEGLFNATQKLYVHVDDEKGITDAVNFAIENGMSMVVVGGSTRLTRSGLSMTDWKVTGRLPPLNDEEWEMEFAKYRNFPEYKRLNMSMTKEEFKSIYWWE